MACSNCYNGCAEIVSDQCVKYTGVDVPVLGILKGDSLSYVEQALITFLTATLDGTGIAISIDEDLYCEVVSQYLQECSTMTALDLFKALVQAACNIQEQIDTVNDTLDALNADYDVDCLDGVTDSSDTHDVLQAVITKLCEIDVSLAALALDVDTNYVKLSELNSLIAAYIASTASTTRYSSRMVPFTIVPYYGSLVGAFDITGAGLAGTEWEDIYLCNGNNGTPDLRGRVVVGAIAGVPGGALDSAVDPGASAFNPNYSLGTTAGTNSITLITTQIPTHNHTLTDPSHFHFVAKTETVANTPAPSSTNYVATIGNVSGDGDYQLLASTTEADVGKTSTTATGITLADTGGSEAHANNQPAHAVYFIMYIP
jgi:microcystin-dependent protein